MLKLTVAVPALDSSLVTVVHPSLHDPRGVFLRTCKIVGLGLSRFIRVFELDLKLCVVIADGAHRRGRRASEHQSR